MRQFFYSDKIFNDSIFLSEDEAHHALKVLRKNKGDTIFVVDGKGALYESIIDTNNVKNCKLIIIDKQEDFGRPDHYIHIAISPTKSHDRIEWFVEKVVELGIQEISFVATENSERNNIKLNRIKKRLIASMKQSLKAYIPIVNDLVSLADFFKQCNENKKFIGYMNNNNFISKMVKANENYCVLIGPEGGFTNEEVNNAEDAGFKSISLGEHRLRTETAGVVACHILNIINTK